MKGMARMALGASTQREEKHGRKRIKWRSSLAPQRVSISQPSSALFSAIYLPASLSALEGRNGGENRKYLRGSSMARQTLAAYVAPERHVFSLKTNVP